MRIWLPMGFEAWRFVIYPIALLLLMLFRPQGIMGRVELGFLRAPKWPRRVTSAAVSGNADGGKEPAA
jgi:branched-chain amino acid transport system permease protein